MSDRASNDGGQHVEEAEEESPGLDSVRCGSLEVEEIEARETLHGGAASDRVVARAFARSGPTRAFGDVEGNRNRGAIKLIGELGTTKRKPADDDASEIDGESVRIEPVEGWR